MDCSLQEYWSGLPFPSPEDLSSLGIEPGSPAISGKFFTDLATRGALYTHLICQKLAATAILSTKTGCSVLPEII